MTNIQNKDSHWASNKNSDAWSQLCYNHALFKQQNTEVMVWGKSACGLNIYW